MSMIAFFTSLAILPILMYQLIRVIFLPTASSYPVILDSESESPLDSSVSKRSTVTPMEVSATSVQSPATISSIPTSSLGVPHVQAYLSLQKNKNLRRLLSLGVGLLVLFPVHVLLTMRLPNGFQWFRPTYIAAIAATTVDPNPIDDYPTQGLWNDTWSIAVATNIGYVPQWQITEDINLKLYPDVIIFYSFLYLVVVVGVLSHLFPSLHRLLGARLSFLLSLHKTFLHFLPQPIPISFFNWDLRHPILSSLSSLAALTLGELFLMCTTLAFLGCFFLYWYVKHGYLNLPITSFSDSERIGRTFGQVAVAAMGLMLLPVSRNGIWTTLFRTNWEAMIKFHRWMGNTFLLLSIAHLICFIFRFKEMNILPSGLLSTPNTYQPHDYTISPMTIIFLILGIPFMGILTCNYVRRQWFELFYFTHFFSMVFMIGILHHAASAWYFILPGIALWAIDHAFRFTRSCEEMEILTFRPACESVIELCFKPKPHPLSKFLSPFLGSSDPLVMPFEPGQIIFLSIPSAGSFESHPFSISSSPLDGVFSCHIRVMGKGSFTDKLFQLAQKNYQDNQKLKSSLSQSQNTKDGAIECGQKSSSLPLHCPTFAPFAMNMDGPYGSPFSPFLSSSSPSRILLIAGGIGITPLHSIFRTCLLLRQALREAKGTSTLSSLPQIKEVQLLWSVRDLALIEIDTFHDTLSRANEMMMQQQSSPPSLSFEVFCSAIKEKKKIYSHAQKASYLFSKSQLFANSDISPSDEASTGSKISFCSHGLVIPSHSSTLMSLLTNHSPCSSSMTLSDSISIASVSVTPGRIDLRSQFSKLKGDPSALVMVCGPEGMVQEAIALGIEFNVPVHVETFLL